MEATVFPRVTYTSIVPSMYIAALEVHQPTNIPTSYFAVTCTKGFSRRGRFF